MLSYNDRIAKCYYRKINVNYFKCSLLQYKNIKYKTFHRSRAIIECSHFSRAR